MADQFFPPRAPGGGSDFSRPNSGQPNSRGGPSPSQRFFPPGGPDVPLGQVITEQPLQSFGSQVTGIPNTFGRSPPVPLMNPSGMAGVPLPGFELLEGIPAFKINCTQLGDRDGSTVCRPGYKILNATGEQVLKGTSDTLFCPFDSKQKSVYISDTRGDCIFHVRFTPSVCECDSEEKRCFAVFSPAFESPFGAIMFEAGQLKYSLRILNALEAETFTVQYMGNTDLTVCEKAGALFPGIKGKDPSISDYNWQIKGADGAVVAIINIHMERCRRPKYSLTLMEEVSSANKALFIGCAITLDLVMGEKVCTKCVCCAPLVLGCIIITGLYIVSMFTGGGPKLNMK